VTTTETTEEAPPQPEEPARRSRLGVVVRAAPYMLIWTTLLVPTLRTMARGWRPLADDASLAILAWKTFSLHPPLVGIGTSATTGPTSVQTTSNPGPVGLWLLGPFVHLDPGQGALLGAAVLCAAVLSFAVYALQKSAGTVAGVIFALVVADLAIVSPSAFVDPLWNPSFAFMWFLAFLAVAFAVGAGNVRYLPHLVFIASVAVDTHLMVLPSIVLVLPVAFVCGFLLRRPENYRWLWWTIGVLGVCWVVPLGQQLFGSQPNGTQLLRTSGVFSGNKVHTFGSLLGFRAFSRAASPSAVWATTRPVTPLPAYNDIVSHGNLLFCVVLLVLIGVFVIAWRQKKSFVLSLSAVTTASALGVIALYARVPANYILSFTWINLAVWALGICIWLTLGLAVVTWGRRYVRSPDDVNISKRTLEIGAVVVMALATVVATVVVMFPSPSQAVQLDFAGMKRVQEMAAIVENEEPQGRVGLGVRYSGDNFFQFTTDEHGVSYLLVTAGWTPGMSANVNGTLGLPIDPNSPFVVFDERGEQLVGYERYPHYRADWLTLRATPQTSFPGS